MQILCKYLDILYKGFEQGPFCIRDFQGSWNQSTDTLTVCLRGLTVLDELMSVKCLQG